MKRRENVRGEEEEGGKLEKRLELLKPKCDDPSDKVM
jgi:hypothetical protein